MQKKIKKSTKTAIQNLHQSQNVKCGHGSLEVDEYRISQFNQDEHGGMGSNKHAFDNLDYFDLAKG